MPLHLRRLTAFAAVAVTAMTLAALARSSPVVEAARVTSPQDVWSHRVGDDGFLLSYRQLVDYWRTLARDTPRVRVVDIGRTTEDRTQVMAIVTSPANQARLDEYRDVSSRLARGRGLDDASAHALARTGKAIVWIDGGLHATEVLGAQQLAELVYQLASRTDDDVERILDDDIVLVAVANPDGMDLVADWYAAHGNLDLPVLYQHYAGHDDNRDFYFGALAETRNVNRVLYREWYPQIVYDHHQTGPRGAVMFAPPFRDPFNYFLHPNVPAGIDALGAAMAQRFIDEGKPGVTSRRAQNYSTWWNGGLRTTADFHNMIGLLTETIGGPSPVTVPFVTARQVPDSSQWWPIAPQPAWHLRQSVDYSMTANFAVLDYASRNREALLWRAYAMARDEIQWGSEDHWTLTPHEIAAVDGSVDSGSDGRARYLALTTPERRDARGYIISADQPDVGAATRFVNALLQAGVEVEQASSDFTVAGRHYPAQSFVVRTAQAFRPQVLDMFEPQDYPDDIPSPGAAPQPPYDSAGYTLAFQMGVHFDRVIEAFDGPFVPLKDEATVPMGRVVDRDNAIGYAFTHHATNSFRLVNRLLAAHASVRWLKDGVFGPGTFYAPGASGVESIVRQGAKELGVDVQAIAMPLDAAPTVVQRPRIGLYDRYGGSVPSGWTRLVLDEFEFPYTVVYPPDLDAGGLRDRFDVLVFNGAGMPPPSSDASEGKTAPPTAQVGDAPESPGGPYAARRGRVTASTMRAIQAFVRAGGTVIAIGQATANAARQFDLPVVDRVASLSRDVFYVPGSILRVAVDPDDPIAAGADAHVDVYYDNDPVFSLAGRSHTAIDRVAWFDSASPLRSGWARGAAHLDGGAAIVNARVGAGRVILFGPDILFRAQSWGTFKLFFNGLLLAATP
ncbi:MAG TPA: M14 metallopeptidase family protein [Vicinamibacterales bacterium]|nr:M14 metallopeptidase family protein [Vicinamibacterales bacterium]